MGCLGCAWTNILSLAHHLQCTEHSSASLLWALSFAHGGGVIFAGGVGAFLENLGAQSSQLVDTHFILAFALLALSIAAVHCNLDLPQLPLRFDFEHATQCIATLMCRT